MSANEHPNEYQIHLVRTIQYRLNGAVANAPESFATFEVGSGVRTPIEILNHITHVLQVATRQMNPEWNLEPGVDWAAAMANYESTKKELFSQLQQSELSSELRMRLTQGPLADALTHVGQLAMLRRLEGAPIAPDNFFKADLPEVETD